MKKGIKLKEIAIDLGVTTRELLDRCRAEGVSVQNGITKVTPEVERRIRHWYDSPPTERNSGDGICG